MTRSAGWPLCMGLILSASGCVATFRPKWAELERPTQPPILRLGEVKESFTGTWVSAGKQRSIRNVLLSALAQPQAAALFSDDPGNLTLNLDIVLDGEDDDPQSFEICGKCVLTLGLIPLTWHTEHNLRCDVSIKSPDDFVVAKYRTHVTGSNDVLFLPPTMVTMLGGPVGGRIAIASIFRRMARSVVADIMKRVTTDYPRLAEVKQSRAVAAGQAPLSVVIGDTPYWVVYNISAAGPKWEYALELHRSRPQPGTAPLRSLLVGTRSGEAASAWQWREPKSVIVFAQGRLWYPAWRTEGPAEKLAAVEFKERAVPAKELFQPGSLGGLSASEWNDLLVAWKNRELVALLREASTADLTGHVSQIEQLVLRANEMAEREKDEAQKLIAAGKPGSELHAEAARAYAARIEILKPVLAAIKAEVANRQK
ncbi:MAG TPA: hypothetical protein VNE39_15385 [Planctomycetota bacterium]|nr:hypothetical protein [Planctomycetota bacterium]